MSTVFSTIKKLLRNLGLRIERHGLAVLVAGVVLSLPACLSHEMSQAMDKAKEESDLAKKFFLAVQEGDLATVRQLAEKGLPLDDFHFGRDGIQTPRTPLMAAAQHGRLEVVKFLLDRGAKAGVSSGGGATALHYAAQAGSIEVVDLLLAAGVDVNSGEGLDNGPPLHWAARGGQLEMIQRLMQKGAAVKAKDRSGQNLLHRATANGEVEIIRLCLNLGFDVNGADDKGKTPLMVAAHFGTASGVREMLNHGASPNSQDSSGRTALHWATMGLYWATVGKGNHEAVVRELLEKGADSSIKTPAGKIPLDFARKWGAQAIVALLEQAQTK